MPSNSLSDVELRAELANYGYPVGPVTATTRKVLVNKLRELKKNERSVENLANVLEKECILKNPSIIVFFDLETSGLEIDCDILQIAVKSGASSFNRYCTPSRAISPKATEINRLYNRNGELYRDDVKINALPVRKVLEDLLEYLKNFEKPCVFVAHNCTFDASRLVRTIKKESMESVFAKVIAGFADTLKMFRDKFPARTAKGAMTLTTLANELNLSTDGVHEASYDAMILEKLALHHFTQEQLLRNGQSFEAVLENQKICERTNQTTE